MTESNNNFIHLHVHTEYSNIRLLDSINKIKDMIKHVASLGQKGIAITDHDCLSGHIEFLQTIQQLKKSGDIPKDFKGIMGNEIYLIHEEDLEKIDNKEKIKFHHFLLLAKNREGHRQLRELSTQAWIQMFNYKGMDRVPTYYSDIENLIEEQGNNLIATTACMGSFLGDMVLKILECDNDAEIQSYKVQINNYILWCLKMFGDDFYIELQPSETIEQIEYNKYILKIAKGYGIEWIIATDAHYLTKNHREIHKAYLTSSDEEGKNREVDDFYSTTHFYSYDSLMEGFEYLDIEDVERGLKNTFKIWEKVEEYDLSNPTKIPRRELPLESTWMDYEDIKSQCYNKRWEWIQKAIDSTEPYDRYMMNQIFRGIEEKIDFDDYDETFDRIDIECKEILLSSEIKKEPMSSYFVTMQKNIDLIWEEGDSIVGVGRGSAGGYIINYLLGIIQLNPLKQGVYMPHWRFISAERVDFPDIDCDFSSHKREVVFGAIQNYYKSIGGDAVRVCTFGTETSKSAIRTSARGLGINGDIASHLSSLIPIERGSVWSLSDCYYGNKEKNRKVVTEFKNIVDKHPMLLEVALGIENLKNKRSSHACGVLIVNEKFTERNAMMRTPNGELVSQFNLQNSEYTGNLKYDFLNTKTCSMIQKTLELLVEYGKIEHQGSLRKTYDKYLSPDVIDTSSLNMWKLLNDGDLISAFQFDSPVGEQAIKLIQPQNLLEAVDANNLMRLMGEDGQEQPLNRYVRYKENINEWYSDMEEFGLSEEEMDIMRKHLDKSYGTCSTQEGMMLLTMDEKVSNFNVVKSNVARKGVAKKIGSVYEDAHKLFYKDGLENGASKKILDYIWDVQIAMQRGYGFSLLHGIEYTYILIQQLNLIYHHNPIYWNTSVLIVESGALKQESYGDDDDNVKEKNVNYGTMATSISHMVQKGIIVSLPHINLSKLEFTPKEDENKILFGLKGLPSINNAVVDEILKNRPYIGVKDFYDRLVLEKKKVVLTTGKTQNKSLVSLGAMTTLIKSGSFDSIENKSRVELMKEYITLIHPPKKSMTMANIDSLMNMGIVPDDLNLEVRFYRFKKFVNNKNNIAKDDEKTKSKKWFKLKGDTEDMTQMSINFFNEHFISELKEDVDFYYDEDGYICVLSGADSCGFDKLVDSSISNLKEWMNSKDCLDRYNQLAFEDKWNTIAKGTISKWEMDSVGFYYNEHELKNVDEELYTLSNFFNLPQEPIVVGYNEWKDISYPKYEISRICGTVVSRNKAKHTVTILTPHGAVLVKYDSGAFSHYDKQISYQGSDGKKITMENGWFRRGTKLLICGMRKGDVFKPKKYRDTPWQHTTSLIEEVLEDGKLQIKLERSRI